MLGKNMRRLCWLSGFVLLLLMEVLIGLYVDDSFIRPYGGDILVVILLGCLVRSLFPEGRLWLSCGLFALALAVEISQYFGLVYRLGLGESPFFLILMGTDFAWGDVWSYSVGCTIFLLLDWLVRPGVVPVKDKAIILGYGLLWAVLSNLQPVFREALWLPLLLLPVYLFVLLFAGVKTPKTQSNRLKICYHGAALLIAFEISTAISVLRHLWLAAVTLPGDFRPLVYSGVVCILTEAVLFWVGILCVYFTSVQLGLKRRICGILCGLLPVLNLIALHVIIHTVREEIRIECEKEALNNARKEERICGTKYPILLVHGIFFRDSMAFNYWGRIPGELEKNGATIRYGNHHSATPIEQSALELTRRIRAIREETGCEKVNIIAHSKGGLDCRYAISELGAAPYVASLTTISTPHRGCLFAECLLHKISPRIQKKIAHTYEKTLKKLGDTDPDFLSSVSQLTVSACYDLNKKLQPPPDDIFCQSYGSVLKRAKGGKFPLNLSHHIVKYYDGENDGLVGVTAFPWGSRYTLLRPAGKKGISHGDMVDISRRNIPEFDVREFYVQLVSDLKQRGL